MQRIHPASKPPSSTRARSLFEVLNSPLPILFYVRQHSPSFWNLDSIKPYFKKNLTQFYHNAKQPYKSIGCSKQGEVQGGFGDELLDPAKGGG